MLAKLYASSFSVGEILYLFSAERHLDGNDDFPLQSANEAQDHPLSLPDDEAQVSLAQLRHRLLTLELHEKSERHWTWPRIVAALSEAFGYAPTGASDPLLELGRHFFPETLRAAGQAVTDADLRFSVPLTSANPAMWNSPHDGPFRYDSASQTLYTRIPLFDAAAIEKLAHLRQLNAGEQKAVQDRPSAPLGAGAVRFSV